MQINSTIKKVIIGTVAAATIGGGALMATRPQPLTVNEFNNLVSIYNYEIIASGGEINLQNIKNDTLGQFDQMILKRVETKSVTINGSIYTAQDYMNLRAQLVDKASKNIK